MTLVRHLNRLVVSSLLLFAAVAYGSSSTYTVEDLPSLQQESQHATASKRITNRFLRNHYQEIELTDEMSSRIFDRYLRNLDGQKSIFTQADVASFEKHRYTLDEALKQGQLQAAYEIYAKFLQRRYERLVYAKALLQQPFDYTKDEYYEFNRKESAWPASTVELDQLWRKRVKYEALNLKLAGKDWEESQEILQKRYEYAIKRLTQVHSEDVFQSFINAFARTIEPHTSYLSPRNADRFKMEMNLSLEGIGAVLQSVDDYTVIRSLVSGGPAHSSKQLAPEDRIVAVAQDEEKFVDVVGWRLDDVVDLIKGPKGTTVRLEILPSKAAADGKTKVVSLVRDKIRLEDRAAKQQIITPDAGNYAGKKVGVIEIPGFYVNLSEDVKKLLAELQAEAVEGIVIDLRNNGGGSLEEATRLTGLFIDRGPVVQIRDMSGRISIKADTDGKSYYDGPLTVLVNRYSASASEIFAAALQDYGRALIIGEQTFGKGTVQQHRGLGRIYDLYEKPMGDVQYTIAKFYRIDGGSTQNLGVVPDVLLPTELEPDEYGESQEENALPWDQIKRAKYRTAGEIVAPLESLMDKHNKRVAQDPEFDYIFQDIAEYRKKKDIERISLNEQQRIDERQAEEDKALARENERRKRRGLEVVKSLEELQDEDEPEDVYLHEAVFITLDMISMTEIAKAG